MGGIIFLVLGFLILPVVVVLTLLGVCLAHWVHAKHNTWWVLLIPPGVLFGGTYLWSRLLWSLLIRLG
ncbi:MAG: hypothetical protein AAGI37_21200 [Planctomycetota bacterium]